MQHQQQQQCATADPNLAALDPESVRSDYRNALVELTFNSKPIINNLTILAQANAVYAPIVVQAISEHFVKTPHKLPALYVIDSICKNLAPSTSYVKCFSEAAPKLFIDGYLAVDEQAKKDFLRVLQTWHSVFDREVIQHIEETIFKRPPLEPSASQVAKDRQPSKMELGKGGAARRKMELKAGRRSSRERDRSRRELRRDRERHRDTRTHDREREGDRMRSAQEFSELDRSRSDAHRRSLHPMLPPPLFRPGAMPLPPYALSYYPSALSAPPMHVARPITSSRSEYLFQAPSEALASKKRHLEESALSEPQRQPPCAAHDTVSNDPLALLTELQSFLETRQPTDAASPVKPLPAPLPFPVIELNYVSLQKRLPDNFVYLYAPYRALQCQNCGLRYEDTEEGRAAFAFHLDCHFKRNRRMNERGKKIFSRDWFLREPEWVASVSNPGASSEAAEKLVPSFFGDGPDTIIANGADSAESASLAAKRSKLAQPIPVSSVASTCSVCGDAFDTRFDVELEEWCLVEACRSRLDSARAVHVDCLDQEK